MDPCLERAMAIVELAANTVVQDAPCLAALLEVLLEHLGETPHARGIDLLATSDLEAGAAKGLEGVLASALTAADGAEDLCLAHVGSHQGAQGGLPGGPQGRAHPVRRCWLQVRQWPWPAQALDPSPPVNWL